MIENTLPLSHIRSWEKSGETATVVVVQRWLGSRVTLILSLIGNIKLSSRFPQYLITAIFVGVCAVTILTQFWHFSCAPIVIDQTKIKRTNRGILDFEYNNQISLSTIESNNLWDLRVSIGIGRFSLCIYRLHQNRNSEIAMNSWKMRIFVSWSMKRLLKYTDAILWRFLIFLRGNNTTEIIVLFLID